MLYLDVACGISLCHVKTPLEIISLLLLFDAVKYHPQKLAGGLELFFLHIGNNHTNWLSYSSEVWLNHQPEILWWSWQWTTHLSSLRLETSIFRMNFSSHVRLPKGPEIGHVTICNNLESLELGFWSIAKIRIFMEVYHKTILFFCVPWWFLGLAPIPSFSDGARRCEG